MSGCHPHVPATLPERVCEDLDFMTAAARHSARRPPMAGVVQSFWRLGRPCSFVCAGVTWGHPRGFLVSTTRPTLDFEFLPICLQGGYQLQLRCIAIVESTAMARQIHTSSDQGMRATLIFMLCCAADAWRPSPFWQYQQWLMWTYQWQHRALSSGPESWQRP